jgi:hypothetical protein
LTSISADSEIGEKETLDRIITAELAKFYGTDVSTIEAMILQFKYDGLTVGFDHEPLPPPPCSTAFVREKAAR